MAKVNGLDKMTIAELKELRARVDVVLVERQASDKAEIAKKLEAMAAEAGYSVQELMGGKKTTRKVKTSTAGSTVAVKYRNPKDMSQTWSGRGRMAKWLADAVKKGQKLESFMV
jgi:DNA-binding protein H-NS